jgi:putative NADH-flavin reductase
MKIVVFGASGKTGFIFVERALVDGHLVTAFVRSPARMGIQHRNLTCFQGDVMDAAAVEKAITGQEAVISVLGPTRIPVAGMLEMAAKNLVTAMQKTSVRRLISTTGAGVRDPLDQPKLADHIMKGLLRLMAGEALRDAEANVKIIRASDLDWTIVRFPRLVDGDRTGKYQIGYVGKDSGLRISRADAADFILNELTTGKYIRQAPVVSD